MYNKWYNIGVLSIHKRGFPCQCLAECFNRNTKTRRPLLITQNGVASKVIIDVADFDNIRETLELMDDLWTAEAELDRGEFTTQEEEIREAHAERERIKRKLGL